MVDHEGHFVGGHIFGGEDEVAFIFAGGGVEDYDEFAALCGDGLARRVLCRIERDCGPGPTECLDCVFHAVKSGFRDSIGVFGGFFDFSLAFDSKFMPVFLKSGDTSRSIVSLQDTICFWP